VLTVLLVRFSSIGDVLLTTPLVRALRRRHPDSRLVFVTKRAMAPLVSDNPHLSEIVTLEPGEPIHDLAARLRARRPTHGLDLHGGLRSRALRLLVGARWSGYSNRRLARAALVSFKVDWYGARVAVAERYFDAARGLDVRPDGAGPEFALGASARQRVAEWLAGRGLDSAPFVALTPGAAHGTKRWPLAYWIALAGRLHAAGCRPVIVGGPDDRGLAHQLASAGAGNGGEAWANAAGEFSLQESGALLARARAVVSGDTGVMHMATAVGTPVVALFGPTVEQFGFFPYRARSLVLERDLACRPCTAHGSSRCPLGHHRCLVDIVPDEVAAAVRRLTA
jgi:heptosyltransferase-2